MSFGWSSLSTWVQGFRGAVLVMTLAVYPLVYLPVAASLRGADPGQEEIARSLGVEPAHDLLPRSPSARPAGDPRRLPARGPRHPGRVRRLRDPRLPDLHDRDLHRVQHRFHTSLALCPLARAGRASAWSSSSARAPRGAPAGSPVPGRGPSGSWSAGTSEGAGPGPCCLRAARPRRPRGSRRIVHLLDLRGRRARHRRRFARHGGALHGGLQPVRRPGRNGDGPPGRFAGGPPSRSSAPGLGADDLPRPRACRAWSSRSPSPTSRPSYADSFAYQTAPLLVVGLLDHVLPPRPGLCARLGGTVPGRSRGSGGLARGAPPPFLVAGDPSRSSPPVSGLASASCSCRR